MITLRHYIPLLIYLIYLGVYFAYITLFSVLSIGILMVLTTKETLWLYGFFTFSTENRSTHSRL